MMDLRVYGQQREEVAREVEQNRLAKTLRRSRRRCAGDRSSALAWESKRVAGRLRKLLRSLRAGPVRTEERWPGNGHRGKHPTRRKRRPRGRRGGL